MNWRVFHSKYGWRNSHKREGVPPFAADHYGFRHSACKRSTNRNFTAPQAADSEQETSTDLDSSNSYWLSRFSGSIPCLPILGSASKSRVSNRTRIRAESLPHKVPSTPRTEVEILLKSFFFNELKTATSNFRPDNVVGEGGFGTVFKGWLDQNSLAAAKPGTGIAVGIKRLNQERHQGREEWFTEIYYLGQLRHPNLVKLIGYCSEDNELLLVYEFMPRGSLENHIFRRSSHFQPLSGTVRMKIALGAAKALAFLHNEAKVIHRDFKTSNILLDSTYNVKISDFGLAVDARAFDRHRGAKTKVMGTYEYAAPEYIETRVMGTYGYAAPEYLLRRMTSGGIRTSVKAYINVQRLASLAVNHENNESINTHLGPLAGASMAAADSNSSYGLCDGNMPCLPILSSATKSCEANQLPLAADTISVNGQPLTPEELRTLQSCPNPPKKLKPGNYWYDKICGLWGKEGQKPSEVISPHLGVGGRMKENASNGSTRVFINGREITKVELRMLQLVGVDCAGNPHFWVTEDGTYQEEGMNNVKGSIWRMAGTKLVCAVLSLPVPSRSSNPIIPEITERRTLQKILLVGCNGSGASTIFKQAKILYEVIPFSVDERVSIKSTIQTNVYKYVGILLEVRERFEEECLAEMRRQCSTQPVASGDSNKTPYSIGSNLKAFSDWLLKTVVSGYVEAIFPAATREFAPFVEELWNDSAIQATYKRSTELGMLPSVATYFIKRAVHILRVNYEPTDGDILYAEDDTSSTGLACVDFSLPQSVLGNDFYGRDTTDQHDSLLRYQLIKVNAGLGESCEWSLELFGDVGIVIFCVSLSDYDQFSADSNGTFTNKMLQRRSVFERIVTHPTFEQMNCLLLLNEFDLFVKKMARVPLTRCEWFDDFNPVINNDLGHRAYEYIAVKFKRLYSSLTDKRLYVSLVEDFEPGNVREALKYSTEILNWDEVRDDWCYSDSDYSISASDTDSD